MDEQYYVKYRYKSGNEVKKAFDTLTEAVAAFEHAFVEYGRLRKPSDLFVDDSKLREWGDYVGELDYIRLTWGASVLREYEFE